MIKLVCMGDSITEGFGLVENEAYPYKLQKLLGEKYKVYNQGVSGSCVTNTVLREEIVGMPYVKQERYKEALEIKGDIYVILLGTNDAQDGMHDTEDIQDLRNNIISYEKEFMKYYQDIIDSVYATNPKTLIYIGRPIPVLNCIWRKHQQKYLDILLPYIEELVVKNPKIKLIDIKGAFDRYKKDELLKLYLPDELHPNSVGTDLIAKTVYQALSQC